MDDIEDHINDQNTRLNNYIKEQRDRFFVNSDNYDKSILTLSSAGVAVMATLIQSGKLEANYLQFYSIACFFISIVLIVLTQQVNHFDYLNEIKWTENKLKSEDIWETSRLLRFFKLTSRFANLISSITFILAIVLFLIGGFK